jgi:hypothetical protein
MDKRLSVTEPEFSTVMARAKREGSTLGTMLRQAWDGRTLAVLTRNHVEPQCRPEVDRAQVAECAESHLFEGNAAEGGGPLTPNATGTDWHTIYWKNVMPTFAQVGTSTTGSGSTKWHRTVKKAGKA